MTAHCWRWPLTALVVGLGSLLASGCVVPEGGYGYHGNAAFGLGYYEPSGTAYGNWGRGYDVGPTRTAVGHEEGGGGHYNQRGGHGQPANRPIPSIPSRERPGGGN